MKPINRAYSSEFHEWVTSGVIRRTCIIQDIDAWAMCVSAPGTFGPLALFELKRSFYEPKDWRPFPQDRNNYAALHRLACIAGIPFFTLYYQKGRRIERDTPFHLFEFSSVTPEYHGREKIVTAATFAKSFPHAFDSKADVA